MTSVSAGVELHEQLTPLTSDGVATWRRGVLLREDARWLDRDALPWRWTVRSPRANVGTPRRDAVRSRTAAR